MLQTKYLSLDTLCTTLKPLLLRFLPIILTGFGIFNFFNVFFFSFVKKSNKTDFFMIVSRNQKSNNKNPDRKQRVLLLYIIVFGQPALNFRLNRNRKTDFDFSVSNPV